MKFAGCALDLMRLPAFCIYDALNEPSASSRIKVVCPLSLRILGAPPASAMPYRKARKSGAQAAKKSLNFNDVPPAGL